MTHGDAREGKWKGNWRMEWVASTLHTTSEHGVSSITTADAHTSAASSRLNWRPRRFKSTCPFRRKTKSAFCGCAITFQTQSTCCFHCLQQDKGQWRYIWLNVLRCGTTILGLKRVYLLIISWLMATVLYLYFIQRWNDLWHGKSKVLG